MLCSQLKKDSGTIIIDGIDIDNDAFYCHHQSSDRLLWFGGYGQLAVYLEGNKNKCESRKNR